LTTSYSWDSTYTSDLNATSSTAPYAELHGWFSEVNSSQKLLKYLISPSLSLSKDTTTFLDLGTGNGEMLFLLREKGEFRGRMVGVDYSEQAVKLCKRVDLTKDMSGGGNDETGAEIDRNNRRKGIEFETWDMMRDKPLSGWGEGFDVVLDKGTFDAVSLSAETDVEGKRIHEGYREKVESLAKKGGLVLVTSCNWTEEELKGWFEGGQLQAVGRVEYRVFSFGGQNGQSVCSVCFRRKS